MVEPQVLGDLNQVGSREYEIENPDLGYCVSFADPTSKLTIYFNDHQERTISSEMALEIFKQAAPGVLPLLPKNAEQRWVRSTPIKCTINPR